MTDATDEDQQTDKTVEDPRTDPANRVADEIDDMQDLILAAGDDATPPPAPELLEGESDQEEGTEDASDEPVDDTTQNDLPDPSGTPDEHADSSYTEGADTDTADTDAADTDTADTDAADTDLADADSDATDADDEPVVPAAPTYQWFDCTGDDAQVALDAAEAARDAVENGELVVLPTDTVYGIGADAFNADAVQRLLDAKVRGRDMPPPVLIADANLMQGLVADVPEGLLALVALHWPGALTVICKARTTLKMDLGETDGTVALRVPDHELTRELLRQTGPLAVSSANLSGLPAALSCDDALDQLGGSIAVYLDGGTLGGSSGASSTIVDFTQDERGEVLRHGALSLETLRETLPGIIDLVEAEPGDEPEAPSESDATGSEDESDATGSEDESDATGSEDESDAAVPVQTSSAQPTRTQQDLDAEATVDWDALTDQEHPEDNALTYGEADEGERLDGLADDGSELVQPAEGATPTTDDLRITHADVDPDQPDLFDTATESPDEPGKSSKDSATPSDLGPSSEDSGARTLQPPTGP